ncbi:hypothetical protein PYV02_15260 [Leifsonia sp. H3M29-4]|uniref:hypothetical protein n=1 Tax=Salinibacterium metalliresistens TaxID=3031321 RepID=UPI0023DB9D21|nr:hypothetical protein [Salinibacterium metalliresistens]MDF1480438.1 hypothetical protein [Salinibacterium metalliresistens]
MVIDPKQAFSALPATLAKDLLDAYEEIVTNFAESRWEPSELNGGKLCEVVFTIINGYMSGSYPDRAQKPNRMPDACKNLETTYLTAARSPRIQMPRMIVALYEIRNSRGVGHAGGDVNPNQMDATAVLYMSKWLMAELVRLLHNLTTDEATEIVDALVEREVALVYKWGDKRRVIKLGLTWRQKVLLLLAGVTEADESDLVQWLEHRRVSDLRKDTLRPMHADLLIDFDETTHKVRLLPPGVREAEALIHKHR